MTKRNVWNKSELRRLAEVAKEYNFALTIEDKRITLTPLVSTPVASDEDERRMMEAFGN